MPPHPQKKNLLRKYTLQLMSYTYAQDMSDSLYLYRSVPLVSILTVSALIFFALIRNIPILFTAIP